MKNEIYPYAYVYKGVKTFLLWKSCDEAEKDRFETDNDAKLLSYKSLKELKRNIVNKQINIQLSEITEMNFDKFWLSIKNMRCGKASSTNTCRILIDGWNFIEDLLRTFGLRSEIKKLRTRQLKRVYKKLFHGINITAVTPMGKSYSPLWEKEELHVFRHSLKMAWKICQPFL